MNQQKTIKRCNAVRIIIIKKKKKQTCIKMYFKNRINQLTDVTYEYASGGELGLLQKTID